MSQIPNEAEPQPGLQVAAPSEHDKQSSVHVDESNKEVVHSTTALPEAVEYTHDAPLPSYKRTKLSSRRAKLSIIVGVVLLILLALALGVGLGLGLNSDDSTEPASQSSAPSSSALPSPEPADDALKIGSSLNASYTSTDRVWNGSAITSTLQRLGPALERLPSDGYSWVIYYQHHSGELRWLWMDRDGSWQRIPPAMETVAKDARNSTSIATFNPTIDNVNDRNIFYIDSHQHIRHRIGSDKVSGWTDGSINDMNLTALDGDLVGLQACDGGNLGASLRLFYAFHSTWEGYNGAAGIGCFTGPLRRYLALVNDHNRLEFWYEDIAANVTDQKSGWKKANSDLSNIHPASSVKIGYDFAAMQKEDAQVVIWNMTWNGPGTNPAKIVTASNRKKGIPGTDLDVNSRNGFLEILYQVNGEEITWYKEQPRGGGDPDELTLPIWDQD